jgi:hypothetical protein
MTIINMIYIILSSSIIETLVAMLVPIDFSEEEVTVP